jgi:prepilin-type N-terminal cleavage/methylation domain-containing protein
VSSLRKFLNEKKGFTLIEVLVAMTLTSIIVSMVLSLFFFGNQSYEMNNKQYDIQSEMRFTMDGLISEIRFATEVFIIPNEQAMNEALYEEGYSYFYIKDNTLYNNRYKVKNNRWENIPYQAQLLEHDSVFTKEGDTLLGIELKSAYSKQSYNIQTQISFPNLIEADGSEIKEDSHIGGGKGLKYKQIDGT